MHDNTGRCTFLLRVETLKGPTFVEADPDDEAPVNVQLRRCALKAPHYQEPHDVELPNGSRVLTMSTQGPFEVRR